MPLLLAPHRSTHAPPHVAHVAQVAPWGWHDIPEPTTPVGWHEGDTVGNPDYEHGHGPELNYLRRRLGSDPKAMTQALADMLKVRHQTLERWMNEREAIHKDVLARARAIGQAQDAAVTRIIDQVPADADTHPVTIHRAPEADRVNQVAMLAELREPRLTPVFESGAPARLFQQRRRLGLAVAELCDMLGVGRTTYQKWEAGRRPVNPEVAARVDEYVAEQDRLIETIVTTADPEDPTAVLYWRGEPFPYSIEVDTWNQAVVLAIYQHPHIRPTYTETFRSM